MLDTLCLWLGRAVLVAGGLSLGIVLIALVPWLACEWAWGHLKTSKLFVDTLLEFARRKKKE